MGLIAQEVHGQRIVEGSPGERLVERANDANRLVEACFEHGAGGLLLYPENLPAQFFDLSSGQAGEILQKLRNYHIRLAIVRTPALRLSSRFGELLADEQRELYFRLLDDRDAAREWLAIVDER